MRPRSTKGLSLATLVVLPVVIVGIIAAGILVAVVTPSVTEESENRVADDLGLAVEMARRICERRVADDPTASGTDAVDEILSVGEWFTESTIAIIDNRSTIVAHTCDCELDSESFADLAFRGKDPPYRIDAFRGSYADWVEFAPWQWTIVAFKPISIGLSFVKVAQRSIFFASLGTILGVVLAFLVVFRFRVTKRLRSIAVAADTISHGEYPTIESVRNDEIGRVARAFDAMVSSLIDKDQAARDAYFRTAESESRFRRVVEASSAAYFYFNQGTILERANRTFAVLHGYERERDLLGRSFESFVHESSRGRAAELAAELYAGRSVSSRELLRVMKDGSTRLSTLSAVPVFEHGVVVGFEGFFIDTTERQAIESALRDSLREKEVLLQEVHHRVRNNLNVVVSLLRLQSASYADDDPTTAAFADAESRIMSMAHVHSLLYESGSLGSIDVESYIRRLGNEVLGWANANPPIRVLFDIDTAAVSIDRAVPLGLVINETLTNAVKHAFAGVEERQISISFRRLDAVDRLAIKDNGVGFDSEAQLRTGSLGMTIMRELAKQIGATLTILGEKGTTVTVTLNGK